MYVVTREEILASKASNNAHLGIFCMCSDTVDISYSYHQLQVSRSIFVILLES